MKRKYSLAIIILILIAEYFIYMYANVTGIRYLLFVPLTAYTFILIRKSKHYKSVISWFTLFAIMLIIIIDRFNWLLTANDVLWTLIGSAATFIISYICNILTSLRKKSD